MCYCYPGECLFKKKKVPSDFFRTLLFSIFLASLVLTPRRRGGAPTQPPARSRRETRMPDAVWNFNFFNSSALREGRERDREREEWGKKGHKEENILCRSCARAPCFRGTSGWEKDEKEEAEGEGTAQICGCRGFRLRRKSAASSQCPINFSRLLANFGDVSVFAHFLLSSIPPCLPFFPVSRVPSRRRRKKKSTPRVFHFDSRSTTHVSFSEWRSRCARARNAVCTTLLLLFFFFFFPIFRRSPILLGSLDFGGLHF